MVKGDACFVPAGAYHCGTDAADGDTSVVLSVGFRSEVRSAAALTASLTRDSDRFRGTHFFSGRGAFSGGVSINVSDADRPHRDKRARCGGMEAQRRACKGGLLAEVRVDAELFSDAHGL